MIGRSRRPGNTGPLLRLADATGSASAELDEQVLTSLYTEHAASVRAFVRSFTTDSAQVEDVVQETFLKVWRHIDAVRVDGNLRSYLFTTARNVLTDQWRAQKRRPTLVNDDHRMAIEPAQDSVDAALDALAVTEALGRLTADHRDVIQALYYDGLTVPEAAERLGIVPGTVKSRAFYAVRALRSACDEMGLLR